MSTKKAALSDGLILERCAADYTPTFPRKKDSVTAETLARLLDGQTISQREAYDRLSTVNIARTIFDLRRYGWPVITTDETSHTRDGRIATYGRYSLAPDVIARYADRQYICDVYAARKARRAQ